MKSAWSSRNLSLDITTDIVQNGESSFQALECGCGGCFQEEEMLLLALALSWSTHACLSLVSAALILNTSPLRKLMQKVWQSSSLGLTRAPSISCQPRHFPS